MRLVDQLRSTPFELILSSGFFGFYAHAGVVRALDDSGLRPSLVGGSSAGALVAGLWGAGVSSDDLRDRLFAVERSHFWDPDPSLGLRSLRPGLLRGERFASLLDDVLSSVGVRTFAECRVPVRVVVFDVSARKSVVLDRGELGPALRASCCVPGMFQPVRIDGRLFLDGGITDRAGIGAASPGARVLYHHLPATSPWRRFVSAQNGIPRREKLHAVSEPRLPRMGPTRLHRGPEAYALAREAMLRALDATVDG